jgi:hypothetical protein
MGENRISVPRDRKDEPYDQRNQNSKGFPVRLRSLARAWQSLLKNDATDVHIYSGQRELIPSADEPKAILARAIQVSELTEPPTETQPGERAI